MAFWGEWGRYVPVAERRAKARREMDKLRKKGKNIQPVTIDGRTIARSFWGKGWCDHLESFSDYANRLPRGRTYVRNGSVCHLDIRPGRIEAIVSGSELYHIDIRIKELQAATWTSIKNTCSGHIGSMLELLQGKLSDQVMAIVTDRHHGLFPQPGEIALDCSCPDWAGMCKHVAAVLYGVGSRLDSQPELLFLLRDVDAQELIAAEMALPDAAAGVPRRYPGRRSTRRHLRYRPRHRGRSAPCPANATKETTPRHQAYRSNQSTAAVARRAGPQNRPSRDTCRPLLTSCPQRDPPWAIPPPTTTAIRAAAKVATSPPSKIRPTGKSVARLRRQQGLSVAQFAAQLGVAPATVYRWETNQGPLNLQARLLNALAALQQQAKKGVR